jgi:hypothetical protein
MLDRVLLQIVEAPNPTAASAVRHVVLLMGMEKVKELWSLHNDGAVFGEGRAPARGFIAELLQPRIVFGGWLVIVGVS